MSEKLSNLGPPVDVEVWVDRGTPGNWLSGKGGTGDKLHIEINNNPHDQEQWVRGYAAGRTIFRDIHIEDARKFAEAGSPAEAIISSRLAKDIPSRDEKFVFNQGVVARAMEADSDFWAPKKEQKDLEKDLDTLFKAMTEAFDTPPDLKVEMDNIAQRGRQDIKGDEARAWLDAANDFYDKYELHCAGVGMIEYGYALKDADDFHGAVSAFGSASEILKQRVRIVSGQYNLVGNTAEIDTLAVHIAESSKAIIKLYSDMGLKKVNKEVLQAAVYDLDDFEGANSILLKQGYELMAKTAHFREKRFYKREAREVAGALSVREFFDKNPGTLLFGGPGPRKNRKAQRPHVNPDNWDRILRLNAGTPHTSSGA